MTNSATNSYPIQTWDMIHWKRTMKWAPGKLQKETKKRQFSLYVQNVVQSLSNPTLKFPETYNVMTKPYQLLFLMKTTVHLKFLPFFQIQTFVIKRVKKKKLYPLKFPLELNNKKALYQMKMKRNKNLSLYPWHRLNHHGEGYRILIVQIIQQGLFLQSVAYPRVFLGV